MWVIIVLVAVPVLMYVALYNGLVGKKNQVENAFAGMDVMLKKRYDLIPNLISTVKNYMTHEKELLTQITELRSQAVNGSISNEQKVDLDNKISKAFSGIMVAVENYPDLKANDSFMQLQRALNEVEEQISASRRSYNASVTDYNNAIEMFPSSIVAGMMNYKTKLLFVIEESQRQNIDVNDLFNK